MKTPCLRNIITQMWKESGSPARVSERQALEWAHRCSDILVELKIDRTPRFQTLIENRDDSGLLVYLNGERFLFKIGNSASLRRKR